MGLTHDQRLLLRLLVDVHARLAGDCWIDGARMGTLVLSPIDVHTADRRHVDRLAGGWVPICSTHSLKVGLFLDDEREWNQDFSDIFNEGYYRDQD